MDTQKRNERSEQELKQELKYMLEECDQLQNNSVRLETFPKTTATPGQFRDLAETLLVLGVDKDEVTRAVYYLLKKFPSSSGGSLESFVQPRCLSQAQ